MNHRLLLAAALLTPLAAVGQATTGSIHGHAQDPAGNPIASAEIQLSTDGKTAKYTFTADQNGDYKGDNVAPGTYFVTMFIKGPNDPAPKPVDRFDNIKIAAGQDDTQDFDLSRPDYIKKLTPEEQKAVAEAKAKNASIKQENAQVKNLNADLLAARQNIKDKKYDDAATLMQKDATAKPDAAVLWLELGIAQNGQKKFPDAITSLKKAIETDAASKKPSAEIAGAANNALGEAYASSQPPDLTNSTAAYDAAVKAQPANAGLFYSNQTIILAKFGNNADATVAAADKAIAADPKKPIPYYLKGQALIGKATVDPKTSKIVAPPGCAEAYEKYLELDPNGPMAADAKGVLEQIGTKQAKSYSAGKK